MKANSLVVGPLTHGWMRSRCALSFAILLAATGVAGCASTLSTLQDIVSERPSAKVTGVSLSDLGLSSVTLDFDIDVSNPYAFDLPLLDFDIGLRTHDQEFMNGEMQVDGFVPANGTKALSLPVRVDLVGLVRTVQSIRPGQVVPYDAEMGLGVDVKGTGPIRLPLRKSGELPVPDVPAVSVRSFEWDRLSLTQVSGNLVLEIANTNEFPFTLSSMDYDLDLARTQVARGQTNDSLELPGGKAGALTIPLSFSPASAGTALLGVLSERELEYSILGSIAVDTPFGPMALPYERSGLAVSGSSD